MTNIVVTTLSAGQSSKEATISQMVSEIDAGVSDFLALDATGNVNVSVNATNLKSHVKFKVSGHTAGVNITFSTPSKKLVVVENAGTGILSIVVGSTTKTVAVGATLLAYIDGTTNGVITFGGGASASVGLSDMPAALTAYKGIRVASGGAAYELIDIPYDVAIYAETVFTNSEVLFRLAATRAFRIPSGAAGSVGNAGVAATGSTTVTLAKNGSSFGTMVWAAAGTVATVTVSADTDFAAGDILTITGPATADATLAQVTMALAGIRR
jgi:hypothetical protein